MSWLRRWWGEDTRAQVLYPAVRSRVVQEALPPKENTIVSIGRFAATGHVKKHREMVDAFRLMRERHPHTHDWRLVLIGSINETTPAHVQYLAKLREASADLPVDILDNVANDVLSERLGKAALYWHMTGVGEDPERSPEKFEHFGMAIVEAATSGCWPIVMDVGGPKEIVQALDHGETVHTISELADTTAATIRRFEAGELPAIDAARLERFSESHQREEVARIAKKSLKDAEILK